MDEQEDRGHSRAPELEDLIPEAVSSDRDSFEIEGVTIPVAGKGLLIRMKDTVRPSDAADVAFLKLRIAEGSRAGEESS